MNRRERIDAALDAALDLPEAERVAWLARNHPDDPALQQEVLALLRAMDQPGILDRDPAPSSPAQEERLIGPYRVIRELGRGGMGVVYLAERSDGQYRRRVAIKILRASPDAEELHRRFLAERQILASLDHPNIALLLDGGVTEGELPYLVMEYVEGMPITAWCDRERLGLRERLRRFVEACAAVSHAHHNLVVHRDLKPGNILVGADGRVKLLDFGIAKLLNPGLGALDQPVTRTEVRLMTPEYASPEQVLGEPLSTASDVYSLGVVLYELLAGLRPYQLDSGSPLELKAVICEREVERPSTRVARDPASRAAAAARGVSPERLSRQLRGDLDAIVMMALRKEPRQRYASAGLLAQDIERFLAGEPVVAHRGSRAYRARRFVTRHRASVLTAALVVLSLLAGTMAALWQAREAGLERDRSRQALAESEEVTGFLMALFEGTDPEEQLGDTVTARDLLTRGEARIDALREQPLVQARLLEVMARVHAAMGDRTPARRQIERSLALRRAALGPDHPDVATAAFHLANILRDAREYRTADSVARAALAIRRAALGPADTAVASSLLQRSSLAVYLRDFAGAEADAREAVAVLRTALPADDTRIASAIEQVASVVRRRGRPSETEALLREAIDLQLAQRSRGNPAPTFTLLRLAEVLDGDREQLAEAVVAARQALQVGREDLGPDHPQLAHAMADLGVLTARLGNHAEGLALAREAREMMARMYGPQHPRTVAITDAEARVLLAAGDAAGAEAVWRREAEYFETISGAVASITGLGGVALALEAQGRLAEAEAIRLQLVAYRREEGGAGDLLTAIETGHLAWLRHLQGREAEAETLFREAIANLQRHTDPGHFDVRRLQRQLATVLEATGRPVEAARLRELAAPR